MRKQDLARLALLIATIGLTGAAALAAQPVDREIGMQPAASPVMEDLVLFHDGLLLPIITAISVFVLGLLLWVAIRYNSKANPVAKKFSHNTTLEVVWTALPIVILIVIAVPSFKLLYKEENIPAPDMQINVYGYQWYWGYEYPDQGGIAFDSRMLSKEDVLARDKSTALYRLAVDEPVVVPVDTVVELAINGSDVIHSWAMPAFGVKKDAVPGRVNATWFKATKLGDFYGQCSELCGIDHAFMPIHVRVVPKADFDAWVKAKQTEQGIAQAPAADLAALAPASAAPVGAPATAPAPAGAPATAQPAANPA